MPTRSSKTLHVLVGVRVPEALRDVLQGIIAYVRERQCHWRVRCVDADEFSTVLEKIPPDGAITVVASPSQPVVSVIRAVGVPVVNMIHDCHAILPSVVSDESATGRLAAQDLMSRGYLNFGYLGFDAAWSRHRYRGFVNALADAGRPCHVCPDFWNITDYRFLDAPQSAQLLQAWIERLPKPIAVFVCADQIAAAALEIWTAAGVHVPEDVAVIGVGNLIATCELAPVPLSSVAVDFPAMGYHAARVLDGLMRGEGPPAGPCVLAPPGVVTRRSTDAFMFHDEHVRAAMRIIHDQAASGLTMKGLLRQIPVSRKWLDLRFKELVGHTPSREMRNMRLERVRELLVNTDLPVQQIAARCGFSRAENLIRFFRDAYGSAPTAYRAKHSRRRHTDVLPPASPGDGGRPDAD